MQIALESEIMDMMVPPIVNREPASQEIPQDLSQGDGGDAD